MLMSPTHRAQVLTIRTQELEPKGNMGHRIDREWGKGDNPQCSGNSGPEDTAAEDLSAESREMNKEGQVETMDACSQLLQRFSLSNINLSTCSSAHQKQKRKAKISNQVNFIELKFKMLV